MYVNFCTYEDFEKVIEMGIEIEGKLVICRLGRTFRGDKIKNAERFKTSGVILYTLVKLSDFLKYSFSLKEICIFRDN